MKQFFQVLAFFIFTSCVQAQQFEIKEQRTDTFQMELDFQRGSTQKLKAKHQENPLLQNLIYWAENGEIHIQYQLNKDIQGPSYQLDISDIERTDKPIKINYPSEKIRGDIGAGLTLSSKSEEKQIHLVDIPTNLQYINGPVEFTFTTTLYECLELPLGVSCYEKPKFRYQWIHWLGAGIGAASILTGIAFDQEAKDIYNKDYLSQRTQSDAEPFFQDAEKKRDTARNLVIIGSSIIAIDFLAYLIRHKRYKEKLKIFEKYHVGLDVKPYFQPDFKGNDNEFGFALIYNFK